LAHWGLIPPWQKEEDMSTKWINARIETVDSKPLFKQAFAHHRCLIVANGFYEWTKTKIKQPYYFHFADKTSFGFAGLLSYGKSKEGKKIASCSILTTEANDIVKPVHHRMPLILKSDYYNEWLASNLTHKEIWMKEAAQSNESLKSYAVSTYVNSPVHQSKKCIESLSINND
jgi:putative SOS response-associated peptidase YedK